MSSTRTMTADAALYVTNARTMTVDAALLATNKRTITGSAAFSLTARTMTASAAFSLATTPIFYLGGVLDSTLLLTASDISITTGAVATGKDSPLGTLAGYGELCPNSAPATWPANSSEAACLPSGKGNIYNSSSLQSLAELPGVWVPTVRLTLTGISPVAITADIIVRFWKWNSSTLTYTKYGVSTLTAQSISTTAATFTLPQVALPEIALASNEYFYIDALANVTSNTNTSGAGAKIRMNYSNSATTGVNTAQVVAPSTAPFRLMTANAAMLATSTRSLTGMTASITLVNTRTVGTNSSALLGTSTRTITATVPTLATASRAAPATLAVLATTTRTAPATAALQAGNNRNITGNSAAILVTATRTISGATAAMLATKARTMTASYAALATLTRGTPASLPALATATRTITANASTTGTFTRSVSCTLSACRGPLAVPYVMQRADSNFMTASGRNLVYKAANVKLYGCTIYLSTQGGSPQWQNDCTTIIDDLFFRAWLNGLNMIRLTDFWDSVHATQQMDDVQVWKNLDYCVTKAQQYGMFVMMDISGYKALLTSHGADPTVASNWSDFVSYVGYHYANTAPQICWYNLSGEPATPIDQTTTDNLAAYYTSLVNTMYAADQSHLISSGGLTHMNTVVAGISYPAWWYPIYAIAHNSILSTKNYSTNDLTYMATIQSILNTNGITKPLSVNEYGAEQEQGDLVFPQFSDVLAVALTSGVATTTIMITGTIQSQILAGTILSLGGTQNCVVATTVTTGSVITVNSFLPSSSFGIGTTIVALGFADVTHSLADTADNYYAAVFGTSVTIKAWKPSNQTVVPTAILGGDQAGVTSYVVWNLGDQQSPSGYDVSNTVMQGAWAIVKAKALADGFTPAPFTIRQIACAAYFSRARTAPATAALLATPSRIATLTAALLATPSRTMQASAALTSTTKRTTPATVPLIATLARSWVATSALQSTSNHAIPSTAALIFTGVRNAPGSAAFTGTIARNMAFTSALLATIKHTMPSTAALIVTRTRLISASASFSQAPRPITCVVSDAAVCVVILEDSLGEIA